MKNDHTFTFTAAFILAGVVLAFVNPADATNTVSNVAGTGTSLNLQSNLSTLAAAVAAPASVSEAVKLKGVCHRADRAAPQA